MIPRPTRIDSGDAAPVVELERLVRASLQGVSASRVGEAEAVLALFAEDAVRLGLLGADFEVGIVASGERTRTAHPPGLVLVFVEDASLPKEAYRLTIGTERVELASSGHAGWYYGTRSLLGLLTEGDAASGVIEDAPRYSWRGVHLDVSRHFYPVEFIERFIDLAALHKLNVFHWHLTDDQGWRIAIDAFPELARVGAFRSSAMGRYGGVYTKAEVQRVVEYARARAVTVVPEIEMPGHAVAALAAYPELSCSGGPFQVETSWGIFEDVFCAGHDGTFTFLERVLDEVLELFPSEFIHVGGDECPKLRWKACPRCQARMKAEGLADEAALQSWFVRRIDRFLAERGRRLVGWDEILEGGLAEGATVMSWRGIEGGIRAAELGHDVVMTPTSHCYLDYRQADDDAEPGAWFGPALDLETVHAYEPTPAALAPERHHHVLGVQANVWTERMATAEHVEYMTFPRLSALAEVAWSTGPRHFADFQGRLGRHLQLLDRYGVGYRGAERARPEAPSREEKEHYLRAREERRARLAGALAAPAQSY